MTDAVAKPFTIVGDPNAAVCEGDFCVIPGATAADIASAEPAAQTLVSAGLDNDSI